MIIKMASVIFAVMSLSLCIVTSPLASAHSGRTDSSGGHNCNVGACAGTYHYHNGGVQDVPPAPSHYEQGVTNGKAHATREADNIRVKSKQSGYQVGYSDGMSGVERAYYATHPDNVCSISFTFDTGTNELYKSAYDLGWRNMCNSYAREVYQTGYDEGYDAGLLVQSEQPDTAVLSSSDSEGAPTTDWFTLGVLGLFVGVPVVGAVASSVKEWWDKPS